MYLQAGEAEARRLLPSSTSGRASTAQQLRFGFHMEPSLPGLHLHVITQDFDSPHLKNKKHWNSFASEFFVDWEMVVRTIEAEGSYPEPDKSRVELLLKRDLVCCHCRLMLPTMPKLKEHLLSHV